MRILRIVPAWALIVLVLMAIGTVWLRLTIIGTTYQVSAVEKELKELTQAREHARFKLAGLRSPRRLEILAKSRFGLGRPNADKVVHMREPEPDGGRN